MIILKRNTSFIIPENTSQLFDETDPHHSSTLIPLSLTTVPREPLKLPTVRIFQPVELQAFKSTFEMRSFADVTRYIKLSKEYSDLQLEISNDCISAYRVVISSGAATIKE